MFRQTISKIEIVFRNVILFVIYLYRIFLSPYLGHHCRYSPSCSEFAQQSLQLHGCYLGLYLTFRRILRCHPFHPGGYDPVPFYDKKKV